MNSYAVTTKYLTDIFSSNPLVNTVIFGSDLDINKTNIFPLVHIIPEGVPSITNNRLEFSYEIAVVNQRQTPNNSKTDKIYGDNLIDNLNVAFAILGQEMNTIANQYNDFDITLESMGQAQPIIFADKNVLDGWLVQITLSVQNNFETCQ